MEYGHLISEALGGTSTAGNIRLECRFHNQLEAQQTFGKEWMSRFGKGAAYCERKAFTKTSAGLTSERPNSTR